MEFDFGSDLVIELFDTEIWLEWQSFNDRDGGTLEIELFDSVGCHEKTFKESDFGFDLVIELSDTEIWLEWQIGCQTLEIELFDSVGCHEKTFKESDFGSDLESDFGSDLVIELFDTGIWLEWQSFNDRDLGSILAKWKGQCVTTKDFGSSSCNKKLIGSRFFYNGSAPITFDGATKRSSYSTDLLCSCPVIPQNNLLLQKLLPWPTTKKDNPFPPNLLLPWLASVKSSHPKELPSAGSASMAGSKATHFLKSPPADLVKLFQTQNL
ncbi:hypothetical protein SLEP1_g38501 [Rubroshorea leprosula]|nr:hypothetical protein SLEP1_g38501 [Rubroshorea leprosula]